VRPRGAPAPRLRDRDARQAGIFDRVVCSTDSGRIAEVAQRYGADIPFLRPSELATSTSPDIEWLKYTLNSSASITTLRNRSRDESVQRSDVLKEDSGNSWRPRKDSIRGRRGS